MTSPRSPLPTSEMTDTPMTPDELEAHGYPRDFHSRKYALPPLADSQEGMEGIGPDGEVAASPPSLEAPAEQINSSTTRDEPRRVNDENHGPASGPPAACLRHCMHSNGIVYASYPPQWDERCCYCGAVERVIGKLPTGVGHGPFWTGAL